MASPIHQQDKVSASDQDSTYLTKGNRAAELGYFDNYLIDNESCVIVGVQAPAAPFAHGDTRVHQGLENRRIRTNQRTIELQVVDKGPQSKQPRCAFRTSE